LVLIMPIPFVCDCGRSLRVKDELAGRKVRCPACAQPVAVPRPPSKEDAEDEALNILLEEEPGGEQAVTAKPVAPPPPVREEAIRPVPPPRPAAPPESKPAKRARRRISLGDQSDGSSRGGIAVNPEIIVGLLMMVGAVIWFLGAMALLNRIYFYPPILFVLGIGAIIRGFTGRE
jgi:hypothetical protein